MKRLTLGGHTFKSRLFTGTGKFSAYDVMEKSLLASGTELVTVALKRISLSDSGDDMLRHLHHPGLKLLPNTSGVRTAREAVFAARMAREALGQNENGAAGTEVDEISWRVEGHGRGTAEGPASNPLQGAFLVPGSCLLPRHGIEVGSMDRC